MDFLSLAAATLAWRREFTEPAALLDDDLRALYAHKRRLQASRASHIGSSPADVAQQTALKRRP